jgi:hypothetical protein
MVGNKALIISGVVWGTTGRGFISRKTNYFHGSD